MPRARTVQEAAKEFSSFNRPLDVDTPGGLAFYVERGGAGGPDPTNDLGRLRDVLLEDPKATGTLFLTGQVGSGKSTELVRLVSDPAIQRDYEVVLLDKLIAEMPLFDFQMTDLLAYVTAKLLETIAAHRGLATTEVPELRPQLEEFTNDMRALLSDARGIDLGSLEGGITLLGIFSLKLGLRGDVRKELARDSDMARTLLRKHVQQGLSLLARITGKPVLLIVDDMERVSPASAARLFIDQLPSILHVAARVLLTMPLSMRFHAGFTPRHDGSLYMVPNVRLAHGLTTGEPDLRGVEVMKRMVLSRVEDALVDPVALMTLVTLSGGHARTLTWLCYEAFRAAARYGEAALTADRVRSVASIPARVLVDALSSPPIRPGFDKLVAFLQRRVAAGGVETLADETEEVMLDANVLLAYQNDFPWYTLHPLLASHPALRNVPPKAPIPAPEPAA